MDVAVVGCEFRPWEMYIEIEIEIERKGGNIEGY